MIKNENLYAEEVIVESPFYYDSHGRLRVRVLEEQSIYKGDEPMFAGTGGPGAQITPAKPAVMPRNADDDAKISATSDKASPNKLTSVAKLVARRTEMNKNAKPVRPQPQVTGGPKLPMKTGISKTTIPPRGSLPVLGRPKVANPAERQKVIGKDALGHPVVIDRQKQPTSPRTLPRTAAGGPALSLTERLNLKKTKMGDVIKDFQQSDAPQFKGKSQEKRRQMAIAAKLQADRG